LRQQTDELERLGIKICVVTFEREFVVRAYIEETQVSWPILIDESRELYSAYGMERGRASDILGFRSWWTYAKLLLRGRRLRRGEGDIYQLGGDVLVDPHGIVRLHHVGNGPADRPAVSKILDVVRESATTE
jgi:alkyl hydroperoxide reductase subunit AhpC